MFCCVLNLLYVCLIDCVFVCFVACLFGCLIDGVCVFGLFSWLCGCWLVYMLDWLFARVLVSLLVR